MPPLADRRPTAAVIGGGPAGLMAAEVLAGEGWSVTVHDHMPSVGRKLLLAGRGGLNITHGEPLDDLLDRYGAARPRLEPAIRAWGPAELRSWCASLGEPTFVGSSGRVFPSSFRATPLLRAWLARLSAAGVRIETRHRFVGFTDPRVDGGPPTVMVSTPTGRIAVAADAVVLALGGASWPRVGSDGGWVDVLRHAGVEVAPLRPSNCGLCITWRPAFVQRHEGAPIKNVALRLDGSTVRGDLVITRTGIEGGPVYALSAPARDAIERAGRCTLTIDLQPDRTAEQVASRLGRARAGDSSTSTLRRALGLSSVATALVHELGGRHLPTEPAQLAQLVTALPFVATATSPIARSISSAGGVRLDEIDDGFMLRRLPGVFVAGEMIDWEAPTGGYLLQASFSSGVAAARGAIAYGSKDS